MPCEDKLGKRVGDDVPGKIEKVGLYSLGEGSQLRPRACRMPVGIPLMSSVAVPCLRRADAGHRQPHCRRSGCGFSASRQQGAPVGWV